MRWGAHTISNKVQRKISLYITGALEAVYIRISLVSLDILSKVVGEWSRYNSLHIFYDSYAALKSLDSVLLNSITELKCSRSLNEMARAQ